MDSVNRKWTDSESVNGLTVKWKWTDSDNESDWLNSRVSYNIALRITVLHVTDNETWPIVTSVLICECVCICICIDFISLSLRLTPRNIFPRILELYSQVNSGTVHRKSGWSSSPCPPQLINAECKLKSLYKTQCTVINFKCSIFVIH